MRSPRQPASVSTWVVRLAALAIAVLGADWVLSQREPATSRSSAADTPPGDGAATPQALELVGAPLGEAGTTSDRPEARSLSVSRTQQGSGIRFATDTAAMIGEAGGVLDRVAEQLSQQVGATATIRVLGREYTDPERDRILKRKRGRAVIAALVERGLPFARLTIDTDGDDSTTGVGHRIRFEFDLGDVEGG